MNSLVAALTALLLWLSPAESDTRFTKYKLSSSSSTFNTSSTSYVDVTNLSLSFKTTGRPVFVGLVADGSANESYIGGLSNTTVTNGIRLKILRDAVTVAIAEKQITAAAAGSGYTWTYDPPSALSAYDFPTAGTYTYKVQALVPNASMTGQVIRAKLLVYELP